MAKNKFQYSYRRTASALHKVVGEILRSDHRFALHQSFQEYPVRHVNLSFSSGAHKFDWVIPKLLLVIECHGRQHFEPTAFDGNIDRAVDVFHDTQYRDKIKREAALAAGYRYITISYIEQNIVTGQLIFDKIKEADKELAIYKLEHQDNDDDKTPTAAKVAQQRSRDYNKEQRRRHLESPAHQRVLEKTAELRKEYNRRLREFKNGSQK